jgi:predicted dehydrogenase
MRTLVAVVGAGSFGLRHAAALRAAGAEPILVPARRARVAELRSEGWRAQASLADARASGARLCVIATDTGRHAADAVEALGLGMDCLVEKPIAANPAQARRIAAAARRTRRKAYAAYILRFEASLLAFKRLLPRAGPLHGVEARCRAYLPDWPGRDWRQGFRARAGEGGALRDLSHELDYTVWMFGAPKAVSAVLTRGRLGLAADEGADLLWKTRDGATVTVGVDYLSRPTRRSMIARGELGTLEWDGVAATVTFDPARGKARTWRFPTEPMARLISQDRAFLRGGRGLATLAEGAAVVALIDAAERSSKGGRAMKPRKI